MIMIPSSCTTLLKGFCIGCADLVPGVSGGTMAFILGIYHRLIASLQSFSPSLLIPLSQGKWREIAARTDIVFLMLLMLGVVCAAMFFTHIIDLPQLLVSHPSRVYGFFLGLVIASAAILVAGHVRTRIAYTATCIGIGIGLYIILRIPIATPQTLWMMFPAGILAASVMLLPGLSGSFVLLLIGQYAAVLTAIQQHNIMALGMFMAGIIVGFAISARIIHLAFSRAPNLIYGLMSGLLIGCAPALWPFQQHFYLHYGNMRITISEFISPAIRSPETIWTLSCITAGVLCVFLLHVVASRFTMEPTSAA